MNTANRIDAILKERNMSRRSLALKAGIPPSSFQSAMERGGNMTLEMLGKVSAVLEVPISALYREPDFESILDEERRGIYLDAIDRSMRKLNGAGQELLADAALAFANELAKRPMYLSANKEDGEST